MFHVTGSPPTPGLATSTVKKPLPAGTEETGRMKGNLRLQRRNLCSSGGILEVEKNKLHH